MVVEADFLFGLSARDKLHPYVVRVLELCRRGVVGIVVSGAAPLEVALVLLSRGFSLDVVSRVLELMESKLAEYGANNFANLDCSIVAEALKLRTSYPQLTFFDSIHVATAKVNGFALATSDSVLQQVARSLGVECLELRDLAQSSST